jgi:hypothetical protein
MGLLNLPFPAFSALDRLLREAFPPFVALIVWGLLAAVLSMLLYRMVSSQGAISRCSAEAASARRALLHYDGDLDGMRPLVAEALGRSARQLRLTLFPAIIASLPLLSLLAWLSLAYGYSYPEPGSAVRVETVPAAAGIVWDPAAEREAPSGSWRVAWPKSGEELHLLDTQRREILSIPPEAPVTVFHKRRWWNAILEHPIGYIPQDAVVEHVALDLPPAVFLDIGPAWARGWEATFFSVLLLCSLVIKFAFRIK